MTLNLLPDRRWGLSPSVGIAEACLDALTLPERIAAAHEAGFTGIELDATGGPGAVYAPSVNRADRARLREDLAAFDGLALVAPHKDTLDVSLISPSAAIRRASVAEIWSVCRMAEALGGGVVTIRTGWPPLGADRPRLWKHLAECLTTLDRIAGDHNATIGIENADLFDDADAFRFLDGLALRHVGVTLDADRLRETQRAPLRVRLEQLAGRMVHLRLPAEGDGLDEPASIAAALQTSAYAGMTCFGPGFVPPHPLSTEQARARRLRWDQVVTDAGR